MDGWNTSFLLGWPIFRCYVSFREGSKDTPGALGKFNVDHTESPFGKDSHINVIL